MTTDITPSLAVISARAENWRRLCRSFHLDPETTWEELKFDSVVVERSANFVALCEKYHLAPNASVETLENAIRHEGFAHAVLSIMGAIGDVAKLEKVNTGNGKRGTVH